MYGLQQMSVTLYVGQGERLLGFSDEILQFAKEVVKNVERSSTIKPVGRPRMFGDRLETNLTGVWLTESQLDHLRCEATADDRSLTSYVRHKLGIED